MGVVWGWSCLVDGCCVIGWVYMYGGDVGEGVNGCWLSVCFNVWVWVGWEGYCFW